MVTVKIVEKNNLFVCGKKTWITGQHNEEFGEFWSNAHKTGLVNLLKKISNPKEMEPAIMGISRVEKDPNNRAFYFYICSETESLPAAYEDMESFEVPAAKWAVFSNISNNGNLAEALIESEMYCHMKWLKNSGYVHGMAPEMEVYPLSDGTLVEYWLPIVDAQSASRSLFK